MKTIRKLLILLLVPLFAACDKKVEPEPAPQPTKSLEITLSGSSTLVIPYDGSVSVNYTAANYTGTVNAKLSNEIPGLELSNKFDKGNGILTFKSKVDKDTKVSVSVNFTSAQDHVIKSFSLTFTRRPVLTVSLADHYDISYGETKAFDIDVKNAEGPLSLTGNEGLPSDIKAELLSDGGKYKLSFKSGNKKGGRFKTTFTFKDNGSECKVETTVTAAPCPVFNVILADQYDIPYGEAKEFDINVENAKGTVSLTKVGLLPDDIKAVLIADGDKYKLSLQSNNRKGGTFNAELTFSDGTDECKATTSVTAAPYPVLTVSMASECTLDYGKSVTLPVTFNNAKGDISLKSVSGLPDNVLCSYSEGNVILTSERVEWGIFDATLTFNDTVDDESADIQVTVNGHATEPVITITSAPKFYYPSWEGGESVKVEFKIECVGGVSSVEAEIIDNVTGQKSESTATVTLAADRMSGTITLVGHHKKQTPPYSPIDWPDFQNKYVYPNPETLTITAKNPAGESSSDCKIQEATLCVADGDPGRPTVEPGEYFTFISFCSSNGISITATDETVIKEIRETGDHSHERTVIFNDCENDRDITLICTDADGRFHYEIKKKQYGTSHGEDDGSGSVEPVTPGEWKW